MSMIGTKAGIGRDNPAHMITETLRSIVGLYMRPPTTHTLGFRRQLLHSCMEASQMSDTVGGV